MNVPLEQFHPRSLRPLFKNTLEVYSAGYKALAILSTVFYFPIGLLIPPYMLYKTYKGEVTAQTRLEKITSLAVPFFGAIAAEYFGKKAMMLVLFVFGTVTAIVVSINIAYLI
jgi:hypothetical protein